MSSDDICDMIQSEINKNKITNIQHEPPNLSSSSGLKLLVQCMSMIFIAEKLEKRNIMTRISFNIYIKRERNEKQEARLILIHQYCRKILFFCCLVDQLTLEDGWP